MFAIVIVSILSGACAFPARPALQMLGPNAFNDSTAVTGPLRWMLHAGEAWLELRVLNYGDGPVDISWDDLEWVTFDGVVHRLVEETQLTSFISSQHAAAFDETNRSRGSAEPAVVRFVHRGNLSAHEAPVALEMVSGATRIAPGETIEWTLYPAEHVIVTETGNVFVRRLLTGHAHVGDLLPQKFMLLVPVWLDGDWTIVALVARLTPDATRR